MITIDTRPALVPFNPAFGERLKDFIRYSEVKHLLYKVIDLQHDRRTDFRSLAVLSAFPGEGKTLFCAALAMAYVDSCRSKILVVDTTTFHHPHSLALRQCIDPDHPQIDFMSLTEGSNGRNQLNSTPADASETRDLAPEPERGGDGDFAVSMVLESEHSLIRRVAKDRAKQYGLVLLDTAALIARNKNNIDPSLVARLSDASVLIAGRTLLNAPQLDDQLKFLKDPDLHLIGVVSNEAYSR
jgi:Mrp family chromosome partitioning ATPase